MKPSKGTLTVLAFVATFVLGAGGLFAVVPPDEAGTVREKLNYDGIYIGNVGKAPAELSGEARTAVQSQLSDLGADPAAARLDTRGGRWTTLVLRQPLLPGSGVGNDLTWSSLDAAAPSSLAQTRQAAWEAFTGYLADHRQALGIDLAELPDMGRVTVLQDGDLILVFAARQHRGLPVRDSYVQGVINRGNLILMATRNWGDVNVSITPTRSLSEARDAVHAYLNPWLATGFEGKHDLVIVPTSAGAFDSFQLGQGYRYRLAWAVRPRIPNQITTFEALVDAHDGEVFAFRDLSHYVATPRNVVGGVLPVSNDGTPPDGVEEAGWPMPWTDLTYGGGTTAFTDGGGNLLTCVDGDITTTLDGQYMRMNDNCGAISETSSDPTLDLGTSGGTDCTVPAGGSAGNTHASRSGFFELNQIAAMGRGQLPNNEWLQAQLTANMNINANCNATWNGTAVNFYTSGGGCFNTGELAAVFDHEWGHGMDDNDANGFVANSGEGTADMYAAARLNTSCIGRGFRAVNCGGFLDPCTACTGVRDIDWANSTSGVPHDVDWADTICENFNPQGAPCGGSVHCEGQIFGEAFWDLLKRDLPAAPYNMDNNTALEVAAHLLYQGSGLVGQWMQCVSGSGGDGCNGDGGYLNFLAADDDNGDLSDGTPHMGAIFAAFDRHQVACPTPTVQDSGCAGGPTTAPVVATTALDRGAQLTWGAVAGATEYEIFRTDGVFGCDFGKIKVGETTGLSFVDSGLQNGREYSYVVIAKGPADSCFGPASSCAQVTPTGGAKLALDAASISLEAIGGDGDVFLDNCELGSLSFNLVSLGTGSQTDVRIVDVTSPSHPGITFLNTFPEVISASLDTCGEGVVKIFFQADGLSFNDDVVFEVELTSDEYGGLSETQTVTVSGTESDYQSFASKTFDFETDLEGWQVLNGTFDRVGGGAADGTTFSLQSSNGQDSQCDTVVSPQMILQNNSTLSMWTNYDIEDMSTGQWWDRATVAVLSDVLGRTLVEPNGGRLYDVDSFAPGYNGCNNPDPGWASDNATWAPSSWTAGALGSTTFAGDPVRLEVIYGTDGALAERGFWFDQVTVTDVTLQVADTSSDVCVAPPAVLFTDGFESGNTSAWDFVNPN